MVLSKANEPPLPGWPDAILEDPSPHFRLTVDAGNAPRASGLPFQALLPVNVYPPSPPLFHSLSPTHNSVTQAVD